VASVEQHIQTRCTEMISEENTSRKLESLGIKLDDYLQFRDSLQSIVFENNSKALISQSNKDMQQQTLDMVQKLSKDLYFEFDQVDRKSPPLLFILIFPVSQSN
jgi:hypothetical protein